MHERWPRTLLARGALSGGRLSNDLVDRVGAGESRQIDLARILKFDVARTLRQLLHDRGREDLAALRRVRDAGGHHHVPAVEVGLLPDRLARVEANADADRA